jgi:hypothetical protein
VTRLRGLLKRDPERVAPILYLAVCILAFGLFIPWLGFYWDDWPTIFYTHSQRISQLIDHFSHDRPFSVWAYLLIGQLGVSPIVWHIAALLIRWTVVLAMVWSLKPLWPNQVRRILFTGLIFAIYPGYYLQPSSVIFAPHLAALGLFFISLGAMGRAVGSKNSWPYWTLSVSTCAIQMFTVEYYVGLELIRPIYLWFLLTNQKKKPALSIVLRLWSPFSIVFAAWTVWRFFLLELPVEPYPLVFVTELKSNPVMAISTFVQTIVHDLFYTVVIVWTQLLKPAFFSLATGVSVLAWILALFAGAGLFFLLSNLPIQKKKALGSSQDFLFQGLTLGIAAFILGMFPVWVIGETIAQGAYNLRYILVAMFGAALIVTSLVLIIKNLRTQTIVVCLVVALAVGNHVRASEIYRADWELQRSFYWQLFWRAPALERNTALISFERLTTIMGDPMTGNALNTLYPQRNQPPRADLWNFELIRTQTVEAILAGEDLQSDYRGLTFNTGSADDFLFYYFPARGCLWILSPRDVYNEHLPLENRELVAFSNTSNILSVPLSQEYPNQDVFGTELERDWCYYFEKADLARQLGKWDEVFSLIRQAHTAGLAPKVGVELLPLVEAYAMTGDFQSAMYLSQNVHSMDEKNDGLLCATWADIAETSSEAQAAFVQVVAATGCASQIE